MCCSRRQAKPRRRLTHCRRRRRPATTAIGSAKALPSHGAGTEDTDPTHARRQYGRFQWLFRPLLPNAHSLNIFHTTTPTFLIIPIPYHTFLLLNKSTITANMSFTERDLQLLAKVWLCMKSAPEVSVCISCSAPYIIFPCAVLLHPPAQFPTRSLLHAPLVCCDRLPLDAPFPSAQAACIPSRFLITNDLCFGILVLCTHTSPFLICHGLLIDTRSHLMSPYPMVPSSLSQHLSTSAPPLLSSLSLTLPLLQTHLSHALTTC